MKKKIIKKEEKKQTIEISEHTVFRFAYEENVRNVGIALAQAGYFIKIGRDNGSYVLTVYKNN